MPPHTAYTYTCISAIPFLNNEKHAWLGHVEDTARFQSTNRHLGIRMCLIVKIYFITSTDYITAAKCKWETIAKKDHRSQSSITKIARLATHKDGLLSYWNICTHLFHNFISLLNHPQLIVVVQVGNVQAAFFSPDAFRFREDPVFDYRLTSLCLNTTDSDSDGIND